MNRVEVEKEISKIFFNIFGKENPFTIQEIEEKFAFDVKLPKQVKDSVTGDYLVRDGKLKKIYKTRYNEKI